MSTRRAREDGSGAALSPRRAGSGHTRAIPPSLPLRSLGCACTIAVALPLLFLGCAPSPIDRLGGAAAILDRFRAIHSQVYRVYSLGLDRDAVHAQLAAAFAGDALTREYVEHWTTLARMRDEGTAIDVLSVDYENVAVAGTASHDEVLVEADWSVGGIVTHQRHKHHRINRYQAVYTLAMTSDDGAAPSLHIVDTQVRNAERVSTPLESSGASAFPLDALPKSARGYLGPAELLKSGLLDPTPSASGAATAPTPASSGTSAPAPAAATRPPSPPAPPVARGERP
jgi:hypothetical protein